MKCNNCNFDFDVNELVIINKNYYCTDCFYICIVGGGDRKKYDIAVKNLERRQHGNKKNNNQIPLRPLAYSEKITGKGENKKHPRCCN